MKNKLKFLTKQSLDKKIKTKWFKGVNILLLVLFVLIMNIDRVIAVFGGDFENQITVYVKDEVNIYESFAPVFEEVASSLGEAKNFKLEETEENIESLKNSLEEMQQGI